MDNKILTIEAGDIRDTVHTGGDVSYTLATITHMDERLRRMLGETRHDTIAAWRIFADVLFTSDCYPYWGYSDSPVKYNLRLRGGKSTSTPPLGPDTFSVPKRDLPTLFAAVAELNAKGLPYEFPYYVTPSCDSRCLYYVWTAENEGYEVRKDGNGASFKGVSFAAWLTDHSDARLMTKVYAEALKPNAAPMPVVAPPPVSIATAAASAKMTAAVDTTAAEAAMALEASILKYQGALEGERFGYAATNCPLCNRYNSGTTNDAARCVGCPVLARTGRKFCGNTPHKDMQNVFRRQASTNNACIEDYEQYQAVLTELKFLRSLRR